MPGWPMRPDADFREEDFKGREIIELPRSSFKVDVGGMNGFDFFGDGSFYILDAPGVGLRSLPH